MSTITAAVAADRAKVTVATVRAWCRYGAITAVKTAGRWAINAASLTHRIHIGNRTRRPRPVVYSVETMTSIGGNRWQRGDKDRVYVNNPLDFAGLDVSRYKSGNICSASYQGEGISNSQAYKLLGSIDKVWFDTATGKLHARYGWLESRVASREQVWADVVAGIRAAITAL